MMTAAKTMAATALELITDENVLRQVREEFEGRPETLPTTPSFPRGKSQTPGHEVETIGESFITTNQEKTP